MSRSFVVSKNRRPIEPTPRLVYPIGRKVFNEADIDVTIDESASYQVKNLHCLPDKPARGAVSVVSPANVKTFAHVGQADMGRLSRENRLR